MTGLMERFTVREWIRGLTLKADFWHIEIAHVLYMDVVSYSKLLINDQTEISRAGACLSGSCAERWR
jgi:hypothetical protein